MGKIIYGKLVRDHIPETIESNGDTCEIRTLTIDEYKAALQAKLQEETAELLAASPEERLGEMADIFEVLLAIAEADGYAKNDLFRKASQKREERGAFEDRIWLESTTSPD